MAGDLSYVRVPHGLDGHSTLDRFRYFRNTLIRICDCCTNPEDVYQSAVLAAMEMVHNKWRRSIVCTTLQAVAGQRLKSVECYALLKAKQTVEWLVQWSIG